MLFKLQATTRRQGILFQNRLRIINVANTEITQALQVMADGCTAGSKEQLVIIRASDHIHWVLDEILPLENMVAIIQNIDSLEQPATQNT
jgi:microcompartment protein CcmK/EutM